MTVRWPGRRYRRLAPEARSGDRATEEAPLPFGIVLFAGHVARENDLLLPMLTRSGADLAALLADMGEPPAGARA